MNVIHKIFLCLLLINIFNIHTAEKFRYISVGRPQVTYINPKFFSYGNVTIRRYGRKDPIYYLEIHANVLIELDNRYTYHFYFYKEWMPNVYKPSFLEMHFKHCDLIHKDKFFGSAMRQGKLQGPCPHPTGEYHLVNMTVPTAEIPDSFPINKGRIYVNVTYTTKEKKEWACGGYANVEIKTMKRKNRR